jgi:AcrR family transcriptional regulator
VVIYVGQGDPEKSMRLLWGAAPEAAPRRGPKAAISVDDIVAAAIRLADEGGIDAVSMRAVGERLGRTPMALYTHVPGKAELIELMWDRVLAGLPTSYDMSDGWRAALRAWAIDVWEFHLAHAWTLDVSGARGGLGPHETQQQETSGSILDGLGLSGRDVMRCVWSVSRLVHGSARAMAETRQATTATGVDEYDWWYARSGMINEVAPDYADRFPFLTRIAAEGTFEALGDGESYLEAEAHDTFEFSLERLLDGIETFVDSSGRP